MFGKTENKVAVQKNKPLPKDLSITLNLINTAFENCSDIVIREFKIGSQQKVKASLVFVDGLVDRRSVDNDLLKSLMIDVRISQHSVTNINDIFTYVKDHALSISSIKEVNTLDAAVEAILSGDTGLFIDNSETAFIVSARAWEARNVDEPDTEAVVRGPREGFVETLRVNTSLLRRKIKNPNMKLENMKIGNQTKTDVCIAYIKGIANDKVITEVKKRLKKIEIDSILESGYIEELIEDAPLSIFPTVGNSEKPDIVSAKILEGRVAILVDGTPFVLTVPYLLVEAFQSSEDYYSRPFYATFIRLLRWLSFFLSVFLPSIYVAVTTFHQELIPPALLVSIAAAEEGIPFPSVVEAFMMQIIYEILREGGVRLPRPIGQAVSIVGALVIGEAAVSAGLIGAPMVIVVALTAISSFVVPALSDVSALARISLIILAGSSGFYGIMLGISGLLAHLCSLRSFGAPYTSPIAPITFSDMKDVFMRAPLWTMLTRPRVLAGKYKIRQKAAQKPKPPDTDGNK